MKKFRISLLVALALLISNIIFAGSPLIKASFYEAYQFNETVQYAETHGVVDGKIAFYLTEENITLGDKTAVINALKWNEKSKANADTYKMFLGRKYGVAYENLELSNLKGDELLCLGYMMLRDENRELSDAIGVLDMAIEKNTQSYITNLIHALAKAQMHLNDGLDCDAWTVCNTVRANSSLSKDINDQAINLIFQEVDAYKSACN